MSKKKNNNRGLHTTDIEELIEKTCTTAIDKYKEKEKRNIQKNKFHNTKLLMENYILFTKHYDNAIDNIRKVDDIVDISKLTEDELYIHSIRRSKGRTMIMIAHINAAVEELKKRTVEKKQLGKYTVIEELYLKEDPLDPEQIAEKIFCSEPTVHRWKNEMIRELSVLIFGIEGLKLDI